MNDNKPICVWKRGEGFVLPPSPEVAARTAELLASRFRAMDLDAAEAKQAQREQQQKRAV